MILSDIRALEYSELIMAGSLIQIWNISITLITKILLVVVLKNCLILTK